MMSDVSAVMSVIVSYNSSIHRKSEDLDFQMRRNVRVSTHMIKMKVYSVWIWSI